MSNALELAHDYHRAERFADAETWYRKVRAEEAFDHRVINNLGACVLRQGRNYEAELIFREVIGFAADYEPAHNNLGLALMAQKRYPEAVEPLRLAAGLQPDNPQPWCNLSAVYTKLGDFGEAILCGQRALEIDPKHADAWSNVGMAMVWGLGEIAGGIAAMRKTVEMVPNHWKAMRNLGTALLLDGQTAEGFHYFEARLRCDKQHPLRYDLPTWNGEQLVDGARLLVRGEQGLGDEVFFGRWLSALGERGIEAVLECDPRLVPLFKRTYPELDIVARTMPVLPAAMQINLGSLPRLIPLPHRPPVRSLWYWETNPAPLPQLEKFLPKLTYPKIGLSWSSANEDYACQKSIPYPLLDSILDLPATFVNLQWGNIGDAANDLRLVKYPGLDMKNDIDGVASLISACDIVVTASNTVAHLAASLSKPTLVMVPKGLGAFFYWGHTGRKTMWYPTAEVFRQSTSGDWTDVLADVKARLGSLPG